MPAIRPPYQGRALVLGYLAFCLLYLGSHALQLAPPTPLQRSALDAFIPLVDWSIWVYLSQFLLLPLAIVWARNSSDRSRVYYAALIATLIAALIFLLWPTQLDRPAMPVGGLTAHAWSLLFATDTDGNCFPSLHVALATLAGASLWRRGWRSVAVAWPALIMLATLTTKQHIVWDTLGGLVLAVMVWVLTPRLLSYD